MNEEDINLRHLRVLVLLIESESLTRVAQTLGTTQSTISKVLAKLRAHFDDALLVRAGRSIRPTPKAIELAQPLRELLTTWAIIRSSASSFDPRVARREFSTVVTEPGMVHLVLPIMTLLEQQGCGLRLKAVPLDSRPIEATLEFGEVDIALGSFPTAAPTLRRQLLYADAYVSVMRDGHPRLGKLKDLKAFMGERHIIVNSPTRGSEAHGLLEQNLWSRLEPDRVHVRVPNFATSALVASRTDSIATMPSRLAEFLAKDCRLVIFATPIALPSIEVSQLWHERVDNDKGHAWFRHAIYTLFSNTKRTTHIR